MRRLFCITLSAITLMSFAFVAIWGGLLVRSLKHSDVIRFASPYGESQIVTCKGGVFILTQPYATPSEWEYVSLQSGTPPLPYCAGFGPGQSLGLGIRYGLYFTSTAHNAWAVAVPFWLLIVTSSLPAVIVLLILPLWKRRSRMIRPPFISCCSSHSDVH